MSLVNDKESAGAGDGAPGERSFGRLPEHESAPLYESVKRRISESILMGEWGPGAVLPGEVELARSFGVAVGTIRRALVDLTAEGLITRRRKTGTVVTGRSPNHSLRFFFQYFRLHGEDGSLQRSTVRVISLETSPGTAEECDRLELEAGAPLLRLARVRHVGGRPVMHERFLIPAARIPDFPTSAADVPELLYFHLLERYGIRISAVREQLSADLADEQDRKILELPAPAAVLTIDEIAYDQAGTPILYVVHKATTERHRYVNEIR